MRVVQVSTQPDCTAAKIVSLLQQDPALCGQLLRTVNSSVFGLAQPVGSLDRAVLILGLARLRSMALGLSLPAMKVGGMSDASLRDYWLTSVTGAMIAREIATVVGRPFPEDDLVAGLLRDLGVTLLHRSFPEVWPIVVSRHADMPRAEAWKVEVETFGLDHADLSAELLSSWNMPADLVESIRYHNRPSHVPAGHPAQADRAELLAFAESLADLDGIVNRHDELEHLLRTAKTRYKLTQPELIELLQGVVPKINEFTKIINLNARLDEDYADILANGCVELVKLTMHADRTPSIGHPMQPKPTDLSDPKTVELFRGRTPPPVLRSNPLTAEDLPGSATGQTGKLPAFRPEFLVRLPEGGCLLDTFEIRTLIGRGGMGVVFKAYEPSLDREVALKVIRSDTPTGVDRFLREGRSAAAIIHENVVTIYAIRQAGPIAYMSMEYVVGHSLQELLDERGPAARRRSRRLRATDCGRAGSGT